MGIASSMRRTISFWMQPISHVRTVATSLLLVAALASCHVTEPSRFPMTGTYDLTTVLDTFTVEIGAGPLACGVDSYCTRSFVDTTGKLSGTFTIGDATDSANTGLPVHAVIAGRFCDAIDTTHVTGCNHASDVPATGYPSGSIAGPVLASAVPGDANGTIQGPIAQRVNLSGVFFGDSIVGKVYWQLVTDRHPPAYTGTFVARRRP